ncbi:hypothetical protein Enr13x_24140 [Stieleria neptunia]|uniref:Uncharacterized protein n=1 Tax=Stieleria neptunia TaxID=2527979 RepID=A0A518HNY9_9BACT|nr:hypothetical protein Enr13x_24140 [Stieleria neptunia]
MKRSLLVFGVFQAVIFAVIAVSVIRWSEARAALRDNQRNEALCKQLAAEIRGLRQLGSVAKERVPEKDFGNATILELAATCRIGEGQVRSIQRIPSAPVPDTDYQQQGISIHLSRVTFFQVSKFALELEKLHGNPKTTIVSLMAVGDRRGTREAERTRATLELWNAELILTQLVYDATSKTTRSARDGASLARIGVTSKQMPRSKVVALRSNRNERRLHCPAL